MIYNILIVITYSIIMLVSPPVALCILFFWLVSRKTMPKSEQQHTAQQTQPESQETARPKRQTPNLHIVK